MKQCDARFNYGLRIRRVKFVIGLGLLWALPMASYADNINLHIIGTRVTAGEHDYEFQGDKNSTGYDVSIAVRLRLHIKGKYANGVATENLTIMGFEGAPAKFAGAWSCPQDPWLNPTVSCNSVATQGPVGSVVISAKYYFSDLCRGYTKNYCFLSRKSVPDNIAKLMRNGPPAPKVSGISYTQHDTLKLTLQYATKLANRFYDDEWYCPPGKDGAPIDMPNSVVDPFFGSDCTVTHKGPFGLANNASTADFNIGNTNGQVKPGTWYVRARLDSDSYGKSLWSHWHKTQVRQALHVSDAPIAKPKVILPHLGDVVDGQAVTLSIQGLNIKAPDKWQLEVEWQKLQATQSSANGNAGPTVVWQSSSDPRPYAQASAGQGTRKVVKWYRIRARNRYKPLWPSAGKGPWSDWVAFGVSVAASSGSATAVPPVFITGPSERQVIYGAKNVYIRFTEPKHTDESQWRCCDYQFDRAIVIEKENQDYVKNATPPGGTAHAAFPMPRQPWHTFKLSAQANAAPTTNSWAPPRNGFEPVNHEYAYQYWVRVREHHMPSNDPGPWSDWRSFEVQKPGLHLGKADSTHIIITEKNNYPQGTQKSGQRSQQHASMPSNVHFGSKVKDMLMQDSGTPPMQTMSGHIKSSGSNKRSARVGSVKSRTSQAVVPHLQLQQKRETVDRSCTNLQKLVTISQPLYNDGGPLAARQAKIQIRESTGAHLASRAVSIPAMAHGEHASVILNLGTHAGYRAKVPGIHHLQLLLTEGRNISTSRLTLILPSNLCKTAQRTSVKGATKLKRQSEPLSAQRKLRMPAR